MLPEMAKIPLQYSLAVCAVIILVGFFSLRRFRSWLKGRVRALDLFITYTEFCGQHFQEVVGGPALLILIWNIWFYVGNPPTWLNWTVILIALVVAGYYAWRIDHIRLVPKLAFGDIRVVTTPTTILPHNIPGPNKAVAQLLVKCVTDAEIHECQGRLLRVWRWHNPENRWTPTAVDEPLDLLWSTIDRPVRTLEPNIDQRLCIFSSDNIAEPGVHPTVAIMQHRMSAMFQASGRFDIFKFDICVHGKDSPPVYMSIKVQLSSDWSDPMVELLKEEQSKYKQTNIASESTTN